MPPFFNGIPYVGVLADGVEELTFATQLNFIGANIARGSGELAQRANIQFPIGLVSLSTTEESAVTFVDIPLVAVELITLVVQIVPVTNGANLQSRILIDGTVLDGANDYVWGFRSMGATGGVSSSGSTDAGAAEMNISNNIGNVADEGANAVIEIADPQNTARRTSLTARGTQIGPAPQIRNIYSYGSTLTNLSAASDLRLFFSVGNIATVRVDAYAFAPPIG